MAEESSQRLPARAVYELLSAANLESVTTLAQASALAEDHHTRSDRRRLIGVAMNLEPQMLSPEGGRTRQHAFYDDVLFGIRMRADAGNVDLLLLTGVSIQVSGEASHYADICRHHGAEGIVLAAARSIAPLMFAFCLTVLAAVFNVAVIVHAYPLIGFHAVCGIAVVVLGYMALTQWRLIGTLRQ